MNRTELLELHDETCKAARAIMEAKNNDYAGGTGSEDPFANFKMASMIGIHPAVGLLLRMMDKVQRIRTFTLDGGLAVKGESVDDACDDIVNYAILCKGLLREERASAISNGPFERAKTMGEDFEFPETELLHRVEPPPSFGKVLNEAAAKINLNQMGPTITSLKFDEPIPMPRDLPPLPPVPKGYDRWEYRGRGWRTDEPHMVIFSEGLHDPWNKPKLGSTVGVREYHYLEAVKNESHV